MERHHNDLGLTVVNGCAGVPGVDASPLMTWGTIDGTPLRLDTDIVPTTAPAFKMPDIPKREAMGIRLAEKAAKASKERKRAATLAAR